MIKKLFLLLIKYIPIIQMVGMLLNNTLYYFDINTTISITFDFIMGNSFVNTFLIIVCSYMFNFCKWHRIIIIANFINLLIAMFDAIIGISINNACLLSLYYIIASISIIIITINHINKTNDKYTSKNIKEIA